jgi:hypothetical protein
MKWFTRDWQRGAGADPVPAYRRYVRSVADRLPAHVLAFAEPSDRHLSVDDAKVDRVQVDAARRRVNVRLLNGDLPSGYGMLDIELIDADLVAPSDDRIAAALEAPRTEFLAHELELQDDGTYEVRFLLWPEGEFAIRCRDLQTSWTPAPDRSGYRREVVGFAPVAE